MKSDLLLLRNVIALIICVLEELQINCREVQRHVHSGVMNTLLRSLVSDWAPCTVLGCVASKRIPFLRSHGQPGEEARYTK